MGLFKPDFFRSLAFGLVIGTAAMAMSAGISASATEGPQTTATQQVLR